MFDDAFNNLMDDLFAHYNREPSALSVRAFGKLKQYPIDQVEEGIVRWIESAKGQFMPTADQIIGVETLTADKVVAMAKLASSQSPDAPKTPLGVLALIHIGNHDLGTQDAFYLRQRAEEFLQTLPALKDRAARGEYTGHEIATMAKYGVKASDPIYPQMPAPNDSAVEKMRLTYQHHKTQMLERDKALGLLPDKGNKSKRQIKDGHLKLVSKGSAPATGEKK